MIEFIVITLVLLVLGTSLLYAYRRTFKSNVKKALNHEAVFKIPDLNDVVITYILFCIIVFFGFAMHKTAQYIKEDVGKCVSDITVDTIPSTYKTCLNTYNNIIFKNQDDSLRNMMEKYQSLIDDIETSRTKISTNRLDNLFYQLENIEDQEAEELYTLLSI